MRPGRVVWLWALCVGVLLISGCYHLRLEATPLDVRRFEVPRPPDDVYAAVKCLLARERYEFEQEEGKERLLVTGFRHFATRAGGLTLPEGGRLYFHRLRVTVREAAGGSEVAVESVDLEIRSSYAYDEGGKVNYFMKRYPYEHYPGMFDLDVVNRELNGVKRELETALRAGVGNGQ
ncbi:hypothetical protein [Geobacter sp.]|uniref:hypothetical protein n=1 Tax=Geobacter sp. TaxID=46610 RepID=UPI00262D1FB9|nr:hypothetical protein [Geobacter sp.]